MKRPCERTWREILEWAWLNETRLAAGKGRRATLYAPISREEYEQKLRQLVLV